MINVLGYKRVIILGILLAVNIVLASSLYFYLIPQKQIRKNDLNRVRGQVATLSSDIDRIQIQLDQLQDQKVVFEDLQTQGFFNNQSRREAMKRLEYIQKQTGVISAVASVGRGEVEESANADKAAHKVVKSPIKVNITAVDDISVYRYLYSIKNGFPGHISITGFSLSRESGLTGNVLRAIASGQNPPLVKASVDILWRSMIPESEVIEGGQ